MLTLNLIKAEVDRHELGTTLIEKGVRCSKPAKVSPQKRATIELVDSSLYERLNKNYQGFKGHELISLFEFSEDWSSWEIHPNGDEIVMLLSGKTELVLELETGNQSVMLENAGEYAVVPINTWHMAKTSEPTQLVFVTPGEDTGHRNA